MSAPLRFRLALRTLAQMMRRGHTLTLGDAKHQVRALPVGDVIPLHEPAIVAALRLCSGPAKWRQLLTAYSETAKAVR